MSTSPVTETLKLAHAALLRIRTASIAGCEEGYVKPEKWADELFTSHGDVTKAMKAIEGILSSGHAQCQQQSACGYERERCAQIDCEGK